MDCFLSDVGSETECEIMPKGYREYGRELDYLSIRIFPEQKQMLKKLYGKSIGRVVRELIKKHLAEVT